MTDIFSYINGLRALAVSLAFFLLISGCATMQPFSTIGDRPAADGQQTDLETELESVATEPEIPLEQELEALASTGSWDDLQLNPAPPYRQPDVVEDAPLYDFPVVTNRQVDAYIDLFQGKQRQYFARWLARSGRYRTLIQKELAAAGLPKDLLYLAMIESGFDQRAYSRSKAVGLWQFMAGTGCDYGLAVTPYVDERRDAAKSTRAAVAYLKDLYQEFGDWYLAVAAYNGGPGTVQKAIKKSASRDFWKIAQHRYLHLETKRYVPKLLAAIIIAKEPEKYGFSGISYEQPLRWDTLEVGPGLSMAAVAVLTGSDTKEIVQLNQELRTSKTPLDRDRYLVKIPHGTRVLAEANLPRLHSVVSIDYKTHIVRANETLAGICQLYNINTTTLLKVNKLTSRKLAAGTRLRIPYQSVAYRILPEGMDPRIAARDELILHTVKKGETISKISTRYQVPADLIVAWNGLSSVHKIGEGQQLALYLSPTANPAPGNSAATPSPSSSEATLVVLSDRRKHQIVDGAVKKTNTWYQVRSGDSLWTISRKFNISPDHIKRWNNLKSNLIHPGSRLKLKDV